MTPLFKKFLGMHWIMFILMTCLLAFGVYAIFNASAHMIGTELKDKWRGSVEDGSAHWHTVLFRGELDRLQMGALGLLADVYWLVLADCWPRWPLVLRSVETRHGSELRGR